MTRKEAREQLFCLAFEQSFGAATAQDIYETALLVRDLEEDPYIRECFFGLCEKRDELDAKIAGAAKGWTIARMSKVTVSAMRVALYEMFERADIPTSVAINEAVELIKTYAGQEDAAYANGVLGTISRESGLA